MTYEEFAELVARLWDEIPDEFKRELQGVHVLPQLKPDPSGLPGVVRLGEYTDPGPPSVFASGISLGRHIALYYGSFAAVANSDPGFDWEAQAWETLLHELRHHVESLAWRDDLIQEDLRQLERLRRRSKGRT